jgi:hypothetical protein
MLLLFVIEMDDVSELESVIECEADVEADAPSALSDAVTLDDEETVDDRVTLLTLTVVSREWLFECDVVGVPELDRERPSLEIEDVVVCEAVSSSVPLFAL